MTYQQLISFSKKITKQYGENYYRATLLFPQSIREKVLVYYAWTRIPDEFVDSCENKEDARRNLESWMSDWQKTSSSAFENPETIHQWMYQIFQDSATPQEYAKDFLNSMYMDLEKTTFENYEELREYMHGSAVVVGLTMLSFFGLHKDSLLPGARALGEAMQLVNFIRDIKEDYEVLGRIYMPQEDMHRFGVSEKMIEHGIITSEIQNLLQFQIARCRVLYKEAWTAIEKLPYKLRVPIRIATRNYEGVLEEIEKHNYNVWMKRHSLSKHKKLWIICKSFFV